MGISWRTQILIVAIPVLIVVLLACMICQPVQASTENTLEQASPENVQIHFRLHMDNDCNRLHDVLDRILENTDIARLKCVSHVISGEGPDIRVSLILDFDRAVENNDIETLQNMVGQSNVFKFRYINAVSIRNVRPSVARELSELGDVSLVELQRKTRSFLNVSAKAVKARTSTEYSGVWEGLGVDGTGVNIAIIDTGVDDKNRHYLFSQEAIVQFHGLFSHLTPN